MNQSKFLITNSTDSDGNNSIIKKVFSSNSSKNRLEDL